MSPDQFPLENNPNSGASSFQIIIHTYERTICVHIYSYIYYMIPTILRGTTRKADNLKFTTDEGS